MTTDLTVGAFNAFCRDVSAMFDTAVSVEQLDIAAGTTKQLKNTYKKLAAVCSVKAQGALNGRFHVVFGTEGLFTLAGTFAMQPEQIIKENRQGGTETDTNELADAVAEMSNLIVGAWDRVFREEMPDHKHFVQSGTFVGNPWNKSEEKIGLSAETELVILTFEMTIDPLPAFKCAVIYPKSLFEPPTEEAGADAEAADEVAAEPAVAESAADDEAGTEQASATEAGAEEGAEDKAGAEGSAEETASADATAQEPSSEESGTEQAATEGSATEQAQSSPETTAEESEQPAQAQEDSAQQEPSSEQPPEAQDEQKEASGQPQTQPEESQAGAVTDAIAKMTHSTAVLPGQLADSATILMGLTAKDVMTTNVVWAAPDETVEQLVAKMQQHDTAYLLIGEKAQLQGIVSKSDVRGALSPYLQSMFAKWRTSMDIATLQIKAQWIMSRPVRTVRGDATLAQVVQGMSEHGGRCTPVTDEQGKVHGIVTVFDIFSALLTCASGVSTAGKTAEAPPLV